MVLNIRVNGKIIKQTDRVNLSIPMVIIMKDNGRMINKMVKEYFNLRAEVSTRVNGKMIYNKDLELKHGKMEVDMKDIFMKV